LSGLGVHFAVVAGAVALVEVEAVSDAGTVNGAMKSGASVRRLTR